MKRFPILSSCTLFLIITLCLGSILIGVITYEIPRRARLSFGPPAEQISPSQRVFLSALLLLQSNQLKKPQNPFGSDQRFEVGLGEPTNSIIERLQNDGLIGDSKAFRDYLVYSGLDTTLQAGEYTLSSRMNPVEIAETLQDPTPKEIIFRILSGWRIEEVAAALPTSGLDFSIEAFLASAYHPPPVSPLIDVLPDGASLEGFLYPDSYLFPRQTSVDGFIRTILEDFQIKVDKDILEGFQRQGLDLYEGVTLASIVQREAVVEDEMPLIASVFINRLAAGIKLETDPTVQYAIGFNADQATWWKNPLSLEDLEIGSPYNTYRNMGLPPGPIANPGLNAMKAVAFPAQTPYYYFRSACDGSGRHIFAETFEDHVRNECPKIEGD